MYSMQPFRFFPVYFVNISFLSILGTNDKLSFMTMLPRDADVV